MQLTANQQDTVEYGIVTNYNAKGGYGFLRVLDGDGNTTDDEVFFHINNGRFIASNGDAPIFGESTAEHPDTGKRVKLAPPRWNHKLVFVREKTDGKKRDNAVQWGSAYAWDELIESFASPATADTPEPLPAAA